MKAQNFITNEATASGEGTLPLNVLILYADLATGLRGKEWIDRVCAQLDQDAEIEVQVWRLDLLRSPACREQAARDAAGADIIVLSAHRSGDLPAQTRDWMQLWLPLKKDRSAALVVLIGGCGTIGDGNNPLLADLKRVSENAGLAFFYQFCGTYRSEWVLTLQPITETAERSPAVLKSMLQQNHSCER